MCVTVLASLVWSWLCLWVCFGMGLVVHVFVDGLVYDLLVFVAVFNDFRLICHGFVHSFGLVICIVVSMLLPCFDNLLCFIFFPFCSHACFIFVHVFPCVFPVGFVFSCVCSCLFICLVMFSLLFHVFSFLFSCFFLLCVFFFVVVFFLKKGGSASS